MALTARDYVTIDELEAEGIIDPGADEAEVARVESIVRIAARAVDSFCRQWFYPRVYDGSASKPPYMLLDGSGREHLHLPAPVISVDSIELRWAAGQSYWSALDLSLVEVYGDIDTGDWQNPKLVRLLGDVTVVDEEEVARWPRGNRNVRITGTFGMCERGEDEDPVTPDAIKRAVMRMVNHERELIRGRYGPEERMIRQGRIESSSTSGRTVSFVSRVTSGLLTGDEMVDEVLSRYRRHVI